ncbi:MAG: methyltransferase domain-containing protein [Proteobacteria bacterium]|nr:methyltransferase domain-containing protein [Pseudomonadota bacterium]
MSQAGNMQVFDRALLRRRRRRAAAGLGDHDFLFTEVAARLRERLGEVQRSFSSVLEMGSRRPVIEDFSGKGGAMDRLVRSHFGGGDAAGSGAATPVTALEADEEALPFAPDSFDLVVSNMALHWVNDLPGCMIQVNRVLRPDGLFLAAMLGGETLKEMRAALMHGEMEVENGASPRVSPFADIRDIGNLLQRAGFALPTIDRDEITVSYRDMFHLMHELRGMGETNAVLARRKTTLRRDTLMAAARYYSDNFTAGDGPGDGEGDGRITATFNVLYITAWAPHPDQPQPLKPGSATTRLADALGVTERK